MGGKKDEADREREPAARKTKEVCCEKYLKKGRRCKSCPQSDQGEGAGRPVKQAEDDR